MNKLVIIHPDKEDKGEILSGNCAPNGDIYLNIEFMWKINKSFNKFIKYFSKVYEHETLHRIINEELHNTKRTQLSEEKIVRKLTGEQLRNWQIKFYTKQDTRNK